MRQSTKRLISLVGALILFGVAFIVYVTFTSPSYAEAQKVKSEMLGKRTLIENQKAAIAQVEKLINQSAAQEQLRQVVSLALPPTKDESGVIHEINTLATTNRLAVQSLTAVSGSRESNGGARATTTISLVKAYGTVSVQVRLAGSYADFKQFLRSLETNVRMFDVRTLNVDPVGKANQDTYTFDLTVATYYQSN